MFVGHSLLAFALAAVGAAAVGVRRRRAVAVGAVAGLFAVVPDVDVAYALVGLLRADGVFAVPESFWGASTVTHRGATHSLVVAVPAAVTFGLLADRWRTGLLPAAALVALVWTASGPIGAVAVALFLLAGAASWGFADGLGLDAPTTLAAALVGLLTHPFGDLLTGGPPQLLYPLSEQLLTVRAAPFADPTLNLLLAFAAELATLWIGLLVLAALLDLRPREHVSVRAGATTPYAFAAVLLPAPTMAVSYHFVFTVLATGLVGATVRPSRQGRSRPLAMALTGLAAVTVAVAAYTVAYLWV